MFKIETYETRLMASTTVYPPGFTGEIRPQAMSTGKVWGPFFWGTGEFGSWFGVTLKRGVWNKLTDSAIIPDGFYSVQYRHN